MYFSQNDIQRQRRREFIDLYGQNRKRIHGYILALVTNWSDADDIMQETIALMWQKFDQYQSGTSFSKWAVQIARYKICEFRRKANRESNLSDDVLESIAERAENYHTQADDRLIVLEQCVNKLKARDKALIDMRYAERTTIKNIAQHVEQPVYRLYKAMTRIHANLVSCVRRSLAMEVAE